jgi:hypothetical protein
MEGETMSARAIVGSLAVVAALPLATAFAQMPAPAQPGPEHAILKKDVGTWDATVEMSGPPGTPAMVSKGTETVSVTLGGLWQVSEFKADLGGMAFEGRGTVGYDPAKKKYVGTWIDSMTAGLSLMEATYDPAKKAMTGWMEGPDPAGKVMKMKEVTEWKDDDTRVFTMFTATPDGKETPTMKITYKRRK